MHKILSLAVLLVASASPFSQATEFTYAAIAKRFNGAALSVEQVEQARMQGECLIGLKALNFKNKTEFDPVAEWTDYRSISLLEQFPPCEVLIMLEVAQKVLKAQASDTTAP